MGPASIWPNVRRRFAFCRLKTTRIQPLQFRSKLFVEILEQNSQSSFVTAQKDIILEQCTRHHVIIGSGGTNFVALMVMMFLKNSKG